MSEEIANNIRDCYAKATAEGRQRPVVFAFTLDSKEGRAILANVAPNEVQKAGQILEERTGGSRHDTNLWYSVAMSRQRAEELFPAEEMDKFKGIDPELICAFVYIDHKMALCAITPE